MALLASGYALLALGAVLVVLPGPGALVLLTGLAVVGRQQHWARRVEHRIRHAAVRPFQRVRAWRRGGSACSAVVPRTRDG